ncbi:protein of unknown function DUF204 [Lachnospiraceae bacterium KM106-2]|nr:protein of unknown function DUF204 [Lachnospiraceae bacterium KM106-2]
MSIIEIFLIAVGLSMDAFAVAVCKGLSMKKMNIRQAITIGLYFGGFQAFMPFLGYILGKGFENYIVAVDHWIAFALLGIIGINMIKESCSGEEEEIEELVKLDVKDMLILSIATSIDALAVGVVLALAKVEIFSTITIIGITTFGLSVLGVKIGNVFGSKYKSKAEFAGGFILVLMGCKILLEHLNIIAF